MKKKTYEKAWIKVVAFDDVTVITASGNTDSDYTPGNNDLPIMPAN